MIYFVVVNPQTADIIQTAMVAEDSWEIQSISRPESTVIQTDGSVTPYTHWYSNGTLVPYTEQQKQLKKNKPENGLNWNNFNMSWDTRPDLTAEELYNLNANLIRTKRNQLLLDSDWTELPSVIRSMPSELQQQWQTYRQALRDITAQSGFPTDVVWPTAPQ